MEDIIHSSSSVVIDIEKIHRILQNNPPNCHWKSSDTTNKRNPQCIISKVPQQMRNANGNLYDPVAISIGPYHHGDPSLQNMERKKWRCLDFVLTVNPRKTLSDYLKGLHELYPLAKSYYGKEAEIESNKFVQMLLLDGCFILTALCQMDFIPDSKNFVLENDSDEPGDTWQRFLIYDLFLAENQVPVVAVKRVHELIAGKENITISITKYITNFFEHILLNYPTAITTSERPQHFHHILHLCQMYLRLSQSINDHVSLQVQLSNDGQPLHPWHRAVEYHQAGLEFVKREFDRNNPHSLLDVSLTDNVMEIPCLLMEGNFITIFKNLIAFEQMNPQFGNDITAYAFFMSSLIRNAEDVNLLVSKGTIEHHFLSDEEVADIFVKLSAGVEFDLVSNFYLKNICQVLGEFYQSRMWWKRWLRGTSTTIRNWILNS